MYCASAQREAHEGARQDRHRDHESLLRGGELVGLADERRHRTVEDPDGEAEVEIEEGGEQGRRVPGFQKSAETRHGAVLCDANGFASKVRETCQPGTL